MEPHGNYYIESLREIGSGSFGVVEEINLYTTSLKKCSNKKYARKKLVNADGDIELVRRFKREVLYQAGCYHANIVPIYLCNLNIEQPWFIMELATNSLSDDIVAGNLTNEEKHSIIKMILCGLDKMHNHNGNILLHRDIKPANILKFSDGIYKISDFGLVKNISPNSDTSILTQFPTAMGTEGYMAPEVEKAGDFSVQSDIFSIGVLIDTLGIDGMDDIINRCTLRRPSARYKNVAEIMAAVNDSFKRVI
ncbi:serine/threonine-protein kinase [Erwinia sp. AG740]|nr:serine/threonine-protein kinase [Erwinia sp. AG740]